MRGLKHGRGGFRRTRRKVAPLVGAWIETVIGRKMSDWVRVAPLVGAWIETQSEYDTKIEELVAPLVGAWIETRETTLNVS